MYVCKVDYMAIRKAQQGKREGLTAANQKWVTDITYIQYGSSTMHLSTIMALFNNEIVAYKMYDHQQTPLVADT